MEVCDDVDEEEEKEKEGVAVLVGDADEVGW